MAPFDGPSAEAVLRQRMDEVTRPVEDQKKTTWQEWIRQLPAAYALPPVPQGRSRELPEAGLQPPLDGRDAPLYLDRRLRSQRRWYLAKARACRRTYLLLYGMIALISTFNAGWVFFSGRAFWLVAATTALNLMLFACLDSLNCGPLWAQYRQAAEALRQIEQAFEARQRPFDSADETVRFRRLVAEVERALDAEFQYWFALHRQKQPSPQEAPPPLPCGDYRPQPLDTSEVALPASLLELQERLARNVHDQWALQRFGQGWTWGPERNDARRENPCLVPYEMLPESDKEDDRTIALEMLKTVLALRYRIEPDGQRPADDAAVGTSPADPACKPGDAGGC